MLSKRTGGNSELTKDSSLTKLLLSLIQSHLSPARLWFYPPWVLLRFRDFVYFNSTPRRKGRKSQSEKSKMNILNLFSCFLIFFMFEIDGRTISEMPLCSTSSSSSLPCFLHAHNIVKFR